MRKKILICYVPQWFCKVEQVLTHIHEGPVADNDRQEYRLERSNFSLASGSLAFNFSRFNFSVAKILVILAKTSLGKIPHALACSVMQNGRVHQKRAEHEGNTRQ